MKQMIGIRISVLCAPAYLTIVAICFAKPQELSEAVLANDEVKVRQLIADGADVNASNILKQTPVFFVENVRILYVLHENGANIECVACRRTPLEYAAENGRIEIVAALRKLGARYTFKAAILQNDSDFLESEIRSNPEIVNERLGCGDLPLSLSAKSRTNESCRILLKHGANPSGTTEGRPVILSALDHPEVLKLLIDKGSNLRRRIPMRNEFILGGEPSILHFALLVGNLESIKICVHAGLDVNAVDTSGLSILGLAIMLSGKETPPLLVRKDRPNTEIIRFLLENDASLRLLAKDRTDSVALAIEWECPEEIIELLMEKTKSTYQNTTDPPR